MSTIIRIPTKDFRRAYTQPQQTGDVESLTPRIYIAVVNIAHVPGEFENWTAINPRDAKTNTYVAQKIEETLVEEPDQFVFKNRGLTLLVDRVRYDNKLNVLELELSDVKVHGLLDGGHTFKIIQDFIQEAKPEDIVDASVKIEVLEGIADPEMVVDIVEARNTSSQVKQQSIENLKGSYQAIKDLLKVSNPEYAKTVAYKEYDMDENGVQKPNDIKDLLSYLICFDVTSFDDVRHPIVGYSSKARVVQHFSAHSEVLTRLVPLLPIVLELRDMIYIDLPGAYKNGGNGGKGGKFGKLKGVVSLDNKPRFKEERVPYIGIESEYRIPSGFIYPLLASFRALLEQKEDGNLAWKSDPVKFWEGIKENLATRLGDVAIEYRNPNKLGKDTTLWRSCFDAVSLEAFRRNI